MSDNPFGNGAEEPNWKIPQAENIPQTDEKPPVEADKVVEVPKVEEETTKEKILEEIKEEEKKISEYQKILNEHGGLESNIPINHPTFWKNRSDPEFWKAK